MSKKITKKVQLNKILIPIIMILIILFFQLIINFDMVCYHYNKEYYDNGKAIITEVTTDKLTMFIPMAEINYKYQGKEYTERKLFVTQQLFGLKLQKNTDLNIYINKKVPNYTLIQTNFTDNKINIILIIINIICLYNLIRKIAKNFRYKNEKKTWKHKLKHRKEIQKKIHEMYSQENIKGDNKNAK